MTTTRPTCGPTDAPEDDPRIALWQHDLKEQLETYAEAHTDLERAAAAYEAVCPSRASRARFNLSCADGLVHTVERWIQSRCAQATSLAPSTGHLSIEAVDLPAHLRSIDLDAAYRALPAPETERGRLPEFREAGPDRLTPAALSALDVGALVSALDTLAAGLLRRSCVDAAETLGSTFGLFVNTYRRDRTDFVLPRQKGRCVLEFSHYDQYGHDRVRRLTKLREAARTLEEDTGAAGLSGCFTALIDAETFVDRHGVYGERVASRTRCAESGPVSAVFFNEKIKLYLDEENIEALISFVSAFATSTLRPVRHC